MSLLAVLLTALGYYFSTGVGTAWLLAWLAPIPVLLYAYASSSLRRAFLAATAAWFFGGLNLIGYLGRIVPVPAVLALLLMSSLLYGWIVVFARFANARLPASLAVFAFPVASTSLEFVTSLVSPHGTSLSLAYSQAEVLPILQIVSATGLWGVTFLVTLVPSSLALAWARRAPRALLPAGVALAAALAFGSWRLHETAGGERVRVGLAVTDADMGTLFETRDTGKALAAAQGYGDRVARLAREGAELVVLPEKLVGVTAASAPQVVAILAEAARASHVTLVAGLNRVAVEPPRNVAVVLDAAGALRLEYDKRHMLPGPETGYAAGTRPGLFAAPGGAWGVAICKDMDFPGLGREYGRHDVRLLAVPAWDFVVDARLHARMAMVRGVENGFALARVAAEGSLTFADAYGRVLAEAPSGGGPETLLVHDLPPGPGATLYTRLGDWFGWACLGLFAGLLYGASALRTSRT